MAYNIKLLREGELKQIQMTDAEMVALKREYSELKGEENIILHIEQLLAKALALERRLSSHMGWSSDSGPDKEGVAALKELHALFPQIKKLFDILEAEERKTANFTIELRQMTVNIAQNINSAADMLYRYGGADQYKVRLK